MVESARAVGATPFDTIYALATPAGVAPRAVLRLSGPRAREVVARLAEDTVPCERRALETALRVRDDYHTVVLPCQILVFPGPRSYSGEDVVELHTISSTPVVELIAEALEREGLRLAGPGEFTRRAFQNGKVDLAQAEAVIALIRARDEESLRRAEDVLAGEDASRTHGFRDRLLALLALLEGGLDFETGETGDVPQAAWQPELGALRAELTAAAGEERHPGGAGDLPSFLLLGPPSAGKTTLWNALRDEGTAGLVDGGGGTTRDVRWTRCGAGSYRLGDSPGRTAGGHARLGGGQELRILRRELALADGFLWLEPASADPVGPPPELGAPHLQILTKIDAVPIAAPESWHACSAHTGQGMAELASHLTGLGRSGAWASEWETLLRGRLRAAAEAVARAEAAAALGTECVAVDLHEAVAALEPLDAASVPEEVLERVFSRFCLGK